MRTAFATAAIAASATALDAVAIPDFIAGFIFGLTGDNHLTEIEQCYQGGESIVTDGQTIIADLKSGHLIQGVKDAKTLADAISPALSNCQNMDGDIAEIEAWAKGFEDIGHLTKEVTKHWLLHKKQVKADIALEESDWSSKDYFGAGKQTAFALDILVPFTSTDENNLQFDILGVPEFAAGFLFGMVGDNHLAEFQTCMTSSDQLVPYVDAFISDLESFKIISAFENFDKFLLHFKEDVAPCKNVSDDVAAIEKWAEIFKEPTTLVETLGKHWLIHQRQIKKDIASEKADWAAGNHFKAGADIADAITLALGPVEKDISIEMLLALIM